jgi:hypothetical protein
LSGSSRGREVPKLDELAVSVLGASEEECRSFALRDIKKVLRPLVEHIEKLEAKRSTLLCPVHATLDSRDKLKPFDNCIACIRNERDELRSELKQLRELREMVCHLDYPNPVMSPALEEAGEILLAREWKRVAAKALEAKEANNVKSG